MAIKWASPRKRLYGLIAVALVLCVSVSAIAYLKATQYDPASDAQPVLSEHDQIPSNNSTNASDNSTANKPTNASGSTNPQNTTLLSQGEATAIAMPYINQYLQENNRTDTNITARFATWQNRPYWVVTANFDTSSYTSNDYQYWITAYEVAVHADIAEIDYKKVIGIISQEEARSIAMPDIEKYATEHNRTIRYVNATFCGGYPWQPRPTWEIKASYVMVQEGPEHWIPAYGVLIWADTGEIWDSMPIGFF